MYSCTRCDESFATRMELEYHMEQEHPEIAGRMRIKL